MSYWFVIGNIEQPKKIHLHFCVWDNAALPCLLPDYSLDWIFRFI